MKKVVIFLCGILLGILVFLLFLNIIEKQSKDNNIEVVSADVIEAEKSDNFKEKEVVVSEKAVQEIHEIMTKKYMFSENEEPGEVIHEKSFKVFSVITSSAAYVYGKGKYGEHDGVIYLLEQNALDVEKKRVTPFYDEQIIKVPKGKEVRMFGTHTYTTRSRLSKTVPVIRILNK